MIKEFLQNLWSGEPVKKAACPDIALVSAYDDNRNFNLEIALKTFAENVWVNAAVTIRANVFATVNFYLEDKKGKRIDQHPVLNLLRNPNENISTYDIMKMASMHEDLTGNAYWKYDLKGTVPCRIQPLEPQNVEIKTSQTDFIESYKYTLDGHKEIFDPEEVTHFSLTSPTSLVYGQSPIFSASAAIDTEKQSNDWNYNFFKNDARTGTIIETDGNLDQDTKDRIKQKFNSIHRGSKNAFKTIIMEGGLKIRNEGSLSQKDMEFVELQNSNMRKVLGAYQVPQILVAQFVGGSLAEAKTAENIFAKYVITPKLVSFVQMLNLDLLPLFGIKDQSLVLKFDPIVEEDKEFNLKKSDAGLNQWMTINERREVEGLPATKGGDELYQPLSQTPISELSSKDLEPGEKTVKIPDEVRKARQKLKNMTQDFKDLFSEKFIKRHEKLEKKLINKLKKAFADQKREVLAKLRKNKAYNTTKSLADDVFNTTEENNKFVKIFSPLFEEIMKEGGEEVNELFGLGVDDLSELPSFTDAVKNLVLKFAKEVNATTKRQIRDQLAEGLSEGEGVDELGKRMSGIFKKASTSRTQTIARTETTKVSNQGALLTYDESEVVDKKEWLTTIDDKERDAHRVVNGQKRPVKDPFDVDGEELRYPGDPSGAPKNIINCRCTVLPVIK